MESAPSEIASIQISKQLNSQLTTHHRRCPLDIFNRNLCFLKSAYVFAVKHGIPYTTLQRIVQGRTIPKGKQLQAIAQAGEVTVDWLLYGGEKPQPKALDSEVKLLELGEENVRIPLINLQVGAGNGYEVMTEEVSESLTLPRRLIAKERGLNPNSLQAVTVMGEACLQLIPVMWCFWMWSRPIRGRDLHCPAR